MTHLKRFALGLLGTLLMLPVAACAVGAGSPDGQDEGAARAGSALTESASPADTTPAAPFLQSNLLRAQKTDPVDPKEPSPSPWTPGPSSEPSPSPWTGGGKGPQPSSQDPHHIGAPAAISKTP